MRFPAELLEEIVLNLAGDTSSLRSCSYSGSAMVKAAQRQLFYTLTIKPPTLEERRQGTSPTQKIVKLLINSPHLAHYVAQLRLQDVGQIIETQVGCWCNWITVDDHLVQLLGMLDGIRHLVWDNGVSGLHVQNMPPGLVDAFSRAFATWPLVNVEISSLSGMQGFSWFRSMMSLRQLRLTSVEVVDYGDPVGSTSAQAPCLTTLCIEQPYQRSMANLLRRLVADKELNISGLRTLRFISSNGEYDGAADLKVIQGILQEAEHSIEEMELSPSLFSKSCVCERCILSTHLTSPGGWKPGPEEHPNTISTELSLHKLTSLRVLTLIVETGFLDWVLDIFQSLRQTDNQHLERIVLICPDCELESTSASLWRRIGEVLGAIRLIGLREVSVRIAEVYTEGRRKLETQAEVARRELAPFFHKEVCLQVGVDYADSEQTHWVVSD